MADMIDAEKLRALKKQHPGAVVVAYVNTSAEVKAESDVCCTSANAVRVVKALKDKEIIFVPDRNLGSYVSSQTGKQMVLYSGFCPTHHKILPEHIEAMRKKYPGAEVLVHPECRPETVALADKALSTSGMVQYVKTSPAAEFIIGTEAGMVYPLRKQNPGKKSHPACEAAVCPNMKKNSLDKVMRCLEEMKPVVKVEEAVRAKALRALDRMLEYGREE